MGPDIEKADVHTGTETPDSSSGGESPIMLEPIRTNRSQRSIATQHRLDGTDPFENLEHALTPDVDPDAGRITHTRTAASAATSVTSRPPDFEVIFEEGDPENPRNWPLWYRIWMISVVAFTGWMTVLFSTSYTSSMPGLMDEFGTSNTVTTLGMTTYLLGLAAGSIVWAPASELYGRQAVYMACLAVWAILVIPSAVAHSFVTILVSRFFW